jgi:3-phytase
MRIGKLLTASLLPLAGAGCATLPPPSATAPVTVTVVATAETQAVGTANADAADDPAIWRNRRDPAASLIVATDKKAGLHVYGLDGRSRGFAPAGRVNNVDLRETRGGIIVAASDRNDKRAARLALYRLDAKTAALTELGRPAAGAGEAYGVCLYRSRAGLHAFMVLKDGTINQLAIDLTGAAPAARVVRTMKLATQSEGCVVDDRTHRLYVGEEDVGVWRFDARPGGSTEPVKIAPADGARLVADVEGVALAIEGPRNGGYLLVSSQGDNAYAVYRLRDEAFVGRFRIAAGRFGSTEETDGIELATGNFGPGFPGGLFIAQDGHNAPAAQNFKLVPWAAIKRALGLK